MSAGQTVASKTRYWLVVGLIAGLSTMIGACGGKEVKPGEGDGTVPEAEDADVNLSGDSDSNSAGALQTVFFPYDSFTIDSSTRAALEGNAAFLKANPRIEIQVEGHCDERGGIQYNIALGEKRANAVRKFMIDSGVNAKRVSTISFGKERPLDPRSTEDAYAKNRRANFVITSK